MTTDDLLTRAERIVSGWPPTTSWVRAQDTIGDLVAEVRALRERLADTEARLFSRRGVWYVRHADGTTEDIVFWHGNLVEDNTGSCGQFLITDATAATADPTPHTETDQ